MAGGPIFTPKTYAALTADCRAVEAIRALSPAMWAAKMRIRWRHIDSLLRLGIPITDLVADCDFTFGVVTIRGREMIVTEDSFLRSYLYGPGLFNFPLPVME